MAGICDGRVALVTGGGSGIERACASAFAQAGACVVVADIDDSGSEETVRQIVDLAGTAVHVHADVGVAGDVETMVQTVTQHFGRLDFAINNAGISVPGGRVHEISEEHWLHCLSINLTGVFLSMKYELPVMVAQEFGVIVNMASAAGLIGLPRASPYVASKHGVVGLTKTAALDYAKSGIRVNAICPGYIHTSMSGSDERVAQIAAELPVGRMGQVREVAAMALYLCSDDAAFVTGAALAIDGGYTTG